MSESSYKRSRPSKVGKGEYRRSTGSMRALRSAMSAGRALRVAPAAAVQMATVQRAETALAMKNAGYVDFALAGGVPASTATVSLIATIKQGSAISERIGAKIKWKSIQVRGTMKPGTSQAAPEIASLLFVYDRFPAGAVPGASAILAAVHANSLLNDANRQRFVIVRRMDYVVGPFTGLAAAEPSVANSVYFIDEYIKLRGLNATYVGTGGDASGQIADFRTGALYVLPVGSNNTPANSPAIDLNIRTRFADIHG